ncbi:MAG TPA: ROK family protein [Spirochaetia bacterium]|nr:ROK family protein [Spirochaetia bacterium]
MTESTADLPLDPTALNRKLVLGLIRTRGPISRGDITAAIPVSATTVKRTVEELILSGIVKELPDDGAGSRPGRRTALLAIDGRYADAIGFAVTPDRLEMVVVNLAGELRNRETIEGLEMSPREVTGKIASEVAQWRARDDESGRHGLLGVGIGVAGLVDAARGLVHFCPNLRGWEAVDLGAMVRGKVDREVVIDEEVRCMALGETRSGASRGEATSLFVYVGRGVGAGIVIDGRLYRGKNGIAGEFGHVTVKPDGPLCKCGNRGCLEAVASVDGILAAANEMVAANVHTLLRLDSTNTGGLTLEEISAALAGGDKVAAMIVDEAGGHIGTGLADLINIFDPGLVVLGGEVVEAFGDFLVEGIKRSVALRGIPAITGKTRIETAQLRGGAAIGAAMLLLERFFGSEILNFV